MAIGDTLRPELLRSDTSGILQGGMAAGRSAERGLSGFGAAIGTAWKDINEKKQKRRDEEEAAQAIQSLDPSLSSEEAKGIARNKNVMDFWGRMKADEQAQQLMEYRDLQMKTMRGAETRRKAEQEAEGAAYDWLLRGQGGGVTEVREPRTVGDVAESYMPPLTELENVKALERRAGIDREALERKAHIYRELPQADKTDVDFKISKELDKGVVVDPEVVVEYWRMANTGQPKARVDAKEPLVRAYAQELLGVVPTPSPTDGRPWLSEAFAKVGDIRLSDRIRREVTPSVVPAEATPAEFLRLLGESDLSPQAKKLGYGDYVRRQAEETERMKAGLAARGSQLSALKTGIDIEQTLQKPTAELRKEFLAQPSVKDFNKVNAAYNKIRTAFDAIKRLDEDKKAAADMAVIFSYMKILDPGSTVREGEYATAQNTTGVPGKIRNWFNNALDGQILNEAQRQAFLEVARDTAQAQFDDVRTYLDFYKDIAEQKGIDTSRVIPQAFIDISVSGLPGIEGGSGGGTTTSGGFDVTVRTR